MTLYENDISLYLEAGEVVIFGHYPSDQYYIVDGNPVRIPDRPSRYHDWNQEAKTWVDKTKEKTLAEIREIRNFKLAESDWTQLPDVPLATKEAWAAYRQALRDVTNQPDPFTIQWPTMPE